MKRLLLTLFAICLMIPAQAQDRQLVILHTNDTHSTVLPLNPTLEDTLVAGRGGYIRRMKMIDEERRKQPSLLLIDSGDFSQGSPYYNLFKGDVEVTLMNEMGYDVATIGNHEFDWGMDNMARLFRMAKFPIVCANYDFTGTVLEGLVKPYVILKRAGLKIGIFGLAPALKGLVFDHNCEGVRYLDPATEAKRWSDFLKLKKKCDLVICVSHLGWQINEGEDDDDVFQKTSYVDLVLGGHSHSYLQHLEYVSDLEGDKIPVDQNGKHAIFVGKLTLDLEKR